MPTSRDDQAIPGIQVRVCARYRLYSRPKNSNNRASSNGMRRLKYVHAWQRRRECARLCVRGGRGTHRHGECECADGVQQHDLRADGPQQPAEVARVADVGVHAARHQLVLRPARQLHHVREVVARSHDARFAHELAQQHQRQARLLHRGEAWCRLRLRSAFTVRSKRVQQQQARAAAAGAPSALARVPSRRRTPRRRRTLPARTAC